MPLLRSMSLGLGLALGLFPSLEAQRARPPAARLTEIPREGAGHPGETMIAVDPSNPRRLLVTYHQAVFDTSTRAHYGERASVHVAWSADGGDTWQIAGGTSPD